MLIKKKFAYWLYFNRFISSGYSFDSSLKDGPEFGGYVQEK